jgi:hypothetical protein
MRWFSNSDTEKRLQTEQYAIQAQRWDVQKRLISGISHNINNALMAPMGHLSYLKWIFAKGLPVGNAFRNSSMI